ncbi:MAG: tetratricopeptide repeat protein [Alphaproteobacteria bacterium]
MSLQSDLDEAAAHHRAGRVHLAEPVYRRVLEAYPDHAEARHLVGVLALQRNRPADAETEVRRAIAANAAEPRYHNTLGNALFRQGRESEALECFERALTLSPAFVEARYNLGSTLFAMGRLAEAVESLQAALDLAPGHAGARNNLGMALRGLNRKAEAAVEFQRVLDQVPDHPQALFNLGVTHKEDGRCEPAVGYFRRLSGAGARINITTCLPAILTSAAAIDDIRVAYRRGLESLLADETLRLDDPMAEIGTAGQFYLAYHGRDDRTLQEMLARLYRRVAPSLSFTAPHCSASRPRPAGRRIRVGFVSHHFRVHTIGKLCVGLVAELPRERIEVFVFSIGRADDPLAERIRRTADHGVTLPFDLARARARIAEAALDVLVYTDIGMEPFAYFLAFARLAPVQCVTWGHPVTSGIDTIDHFISSEHLETPDSPAQYSESLYRLRHPPTYYYRPGMPAVRRDRAHFSLSAEARLYVCPQSPFKFHPAFDSVLAEILRRDRKALVVVIDGRDPGWLESLRRRWRTHMPDVAERMRVLPSMPLDDFLSLVALADVMLDIPEFSGGNTSLEAFHMGTPIVTLPSPFLRGRTTHAFYRRMGLDVGIARDRADYVERALAIAADPEPARRMIAAAAPALYEDRQVLDDLVCFLLEAVETDQCAARHF